MLIIILFFTSFPYNYDYASYDDKPGKFASGGNHNLWIKSDGTLWAWGYNFYGQLGDGTSGAGTDKNTPVRIGDDNKWTAVAARINHSIGLKSDGTLWGWGWRQ